MKQENIQKIYESKNSTIYKGVYNGFEKKVLIKFLNIETHSEEQILKLNNEYEFTHNLGISGVRKVLKKDKKDEQNILISEYFEGQTLKDFINQDNKFELLIKVAINISQTLGEIHQHNIIHKDINSNNILINKKHEIKIIDFGLATKYTLKTQNQFNPKHIEGTLAYISPEQTGRMNRSVDTRSDLYSFGVILYEMFTKQLPFSKKDKLELIHSHIAKIPIPPIDINKNISKILSDIIIKSLSKNAEDRYQSAFGLKHDLQQILNPQGFQNLVGFVIGENDFSGRLIIPEKLYGREKELEKLREIYKNVSVGKTQLLLISGLAGVGKSALIHEIHKPLTKTRGLYIEGKFDQFQKDIPYYAIIQVFTDFTNIILKESEKELLYWKDLIQNSLGSIGEVITSLIPNLELIIGKQPKLPQIDGKQAQNRFNYVWSNFVKAISQAKHPLVIFIDDLQWADNSSIKLLKTLLTEPEINYLLIIIAYRENEINITDLQEFEKLAELIISKIKLDNLKQNDVNNLLNDILNPQGLLKPQSLKNIVELIYSKTLGNAFFTIQFLKNLYEEEFLKFDFTKNIWNWNFKEIEKQNITDNVIELMVNKVQKLPKNTQNILKIAACVGNKFDLKLLSIIYKKDKNIAKNDLEPAIFENLIVPKDNRKYKFIHDRIQQAVYSTILDNEKNKFHLQTGKLLLNSLDKKDLEKQIIEVVNQLNFGIDLIKDKEEKHKFIELNFRAGLKAKSTTAYLRAFNYFKICEKLLETNMWKTNYSLCLKIYDELSELSYLSGFYKETEKYSKIINENTSNILHKVNSYYNLINVYRAQALFNDVMKIGFKILSELGVKFPKKVSLLHIIYSLIRVSISLKRRGFDNLKELPLMNNEYAIAKLKLIDAIVTSVYFTNKKLTPILVSNGIILMTNYGHSQYSSYSISGYGVILTILGKIEQSYKLGKLANEIQEKYNFNKIKSRINYVNLSSINIWKENFHNVTERILGNYKIALEVGDIEFASYSIGLSLLNYLFCDMNLQKLENNYFKNIKQIERFNQKRSYLMVLFNMKLISNLLGKNYKNIHLLSSEKFNEDKEILNYIKNRDITSLGNLFLEKIFLIYIFNNTSEMENVIDNLLKYQEGITAYYSFALTKFYHSLCLLMLYDNIDKKQKIIIVKKVSKNQKKMKKWAKHCPENFQNKYDLVEAEKCRVLGKKELAQDFYNKAIKAANKNRFLSEEAISLEAAARYYIQEDNQKLAKLYLQDAYKTYETWGATAKLKQLEDKYPEYITKKQYLLQREASSNKTTKTLSLDLKSIVKANQLLSGEVKFEKLLKTMLMLIMENAGADYAVIIQNNEEKYTIEAKGSHSSKNIKVLQSENLEKTEALALNIVKYVIRTRKFIVIDNASTDKNYSGNIYIRKNNIKSIFCYPVIHKNKLVAVLYLENNLSTHVFKSVHIEAIKILSSQIAISIENSLIYNNLESIVDARTKELKKSELNLKILNATKDRFFSIIAHDLKSLFNSIIGFSGMLNSNFDNYNTATQKEFISYINQSAQNTYKLLENLLLWALSQRKTISFHPVNENLFLLSQSTVIILEQTAEKKSITIINNISKDIFVKVDKNLLSTVIRNLISNAIKFTPKEGQIILKAHMITTVNKQNFIEIAISDTGIGIPIKTLSKIFNIEDNITTKGTEEETGTGLGLILCKEFVEKHGGKIWVESEIGIGSTFYFTLPI